MDRGLQLARLLLRSAVRLRSRSGAPAASDRSPVAIHMPIGIVLALVVVCGVGAYGGVTGCRGEQLVGGRFHRPRGIILVLIDALRADHLGVYGDRRGLTPALDALARGGFVFTNAWATSSWTRSSVASLFTSQYPSAVRVLNRLAAIPPETHTLAEVLSTATGAECAAISTNGNAGPKFGFAKGFSAFMEPTMQRTLPGDRYPIMPADGVTLDALAWLEHRDRGRPFFLFLHYVDPHEPYVPPDGILRDPEPPGRFTGSRADLGRMNRVPELLTETDRDRIRYLYAAEVKYVDAWIGRLLDGLGHAGIRDEVLIVVTADHGEALWEHGHRGHGRDLYEETLRVPLIFAWPRMTGEEGRRIDDVVSLVDVAPTVLAAWGIAPPREFQGQDLVPLMAGEPTVLLRGMAYAEMDVDGVDLEAVRVGTGKLIRDRAADDGVAPALYDLVHDPGETRDVGEAEPALRARLEQELERQGRENAVLAHVNRSVDLETLPAFLVERLRVLGYVTDEEYADFLARQGKAQEGASVKEDRLDADGAHPHATDADSH